MNLTVRYFNQSWLRLFLIIITSYLIILWLSKNILINETVFYNTFSEQLTYQRAMDLFKNVNSFNWITYLITPLWLIIKFTLISIVLYTGVFFLNLHYKISFGLIFKVVIASEIIFVLAACARFMWFYFFAGSYDLNDLNFFYPLSLINLFDIAEVNKMWILPLQSINLFQVSYILVLAMGLRLVGQIEKIESEKIVIYSYPPALFFWIVLIMFLSIDVT